MVNHEIQGKVDTCPIIEVHDRTMNECKTFLILTEIATENYGIKQNDLN